MLKVALFVFAMNTVWHERCGGSPEVKEKPKTPTDNGSVWGHPAARYLVVGVVGSLR